jgi:hydrogenase maturation protease
MAVKCIAIGNRIMGDDSIGIRVADALLPKLRRENIEVIFGETDIGYALSKIEDEDFLFLMDATYFDMKPGTVTFTPIKEDRIYHQPYYSQHQPSLINFLKIYKKSVEGFIIGIEVAEINFDLELSDRLNIEFSSICEKVYRFIYHTMRGGWVMHDTYLLNKISQSLKEICTENQIKRIDQFTLVVNHHSHIDESNLQEYLAIHNKNMIGNTLQITIRREDIEDQTAIIHSIQGDTLEI